MQVETLDGDELDAAFDAEPTAELSEVVPAVVAANRPPPPPAAEQEQESPAPEHRAPTPDTPPPPEPEAGRA